MFYCEEFKSLSVLSLYEGELLGRVDKLYFNKNLKKLIEIELIGENGAKIYLPTKNIYNIGKNAITVKNNQAVVLGEEKTSLCAAPVGSKAYSINGEFLGVISEISFDEKFQTSKIELENNKLLNVDNLASCGKNAVIFNMDDNKINLKKFTPPKPPLELKTQNAVPVATLPTEGRGVVPVESGKLIVEQNADFLVGRKCLKDIVSFNNETLIKGNSIITKKSLKEIIKFGKLRELMLYSK